VVGAPSWTAQPFLGKPLHGLVVMLLSHSRWELSLRPLVSKVRSALSPVDRDPAAPLLRGAVGGYRMFLPPGTVVDLDSARRFVHDAEAALATDRLADAGAAALVSQAIAARPFLPGVNNPWADDMHRELDNLRVRALMIQATAALGLGDPEEAIRCAERILKLDPYRERAVQVLMRAWAANRTAFVPSPPTTNSAGIWTQS
jgi:DNA-binding SARP family transcriptional activator